MLALAISTLCLCQDLTSGGPDSIIAGPFGEPRMVMSEGGEWSYPIKVFANNEVETFVPDITSPGWVSWHVAEFRTNGTYVTYLYVYRRQSRKTGRETIYVNSRANTATVVRPLLQPIHIDISKAPLELARSIPKITEIVTEDAESFRGSTVQEDVSKDRLFAARMALCDGAGASNPDCNLSDSDFEKKHPIYVTDPLRLIQGANPGVNCGIGTSKSCYYYAPENQEANRPASPTMPSVGDVSPPVVLSQAEAEYSDDARRAKLQGVCLIQTMVDTQGNPQNPHVILSLGKGLDEKAVEAVLKYRFKPAMKGNTPVPMTITVEVDFHLF